MTRSGISGFINTFAGCEVILEADNGLELIEGMEGLEKTKAPMPDICILDIFMPVLNGYDTLIRLREKWPEMYALVLTGHNTDYYLLQMVRAGANGFLRKNCSPKDLEKAIRNIYEYGIYTPADSDFGKQFKAYKAQKLKLPELSPDEIELLRLCCSDMNYTTIAGKMSVTDHRVEWLRNSLFKKFHVSSRSGLVMYAIQLGLVELNIDETGSIPNLKK